MINFKLVPYKWQQNMDIIMQNVNLCKLEFRKPGVIQFDFLDSINGDFYKTIFCHNVWKYSEENRFDKGEEFAIFICDIRSAKLTGVEIKGAFNYLRYGFDIPESDEYTLLCMDSGEVSIDLICETVEVVD